MGRDRLEGLAVEWGNPTTKRWLKLIALDIERKKHSTSKNSVHRRSERSLSQPLRLSISVFFSYTESIVQIARREVRVGNNNDAAEPLSSRIATAAMPNNNNGIPRP